ncbi:hypothetical protein BDZ94DRAFT_1272091, partial [Collybia nuda]
MLQPLMLEFLASLHSLGKEHLVRDNEGVQRPSHVLHSRLNPKIALIVFETVLLSQQQALLYHDLFSCPSETSPPWPAGVLPNNVNDEMSIPPPSF